MRPLVLFTLIHQINCALLTIYETHIQTVTESVQEIAFETLTQWSTNYIETTTTHTSTIVTTTTMEALDAHALFRHNDKRQLHVNTSDLLWDESLAQEAQFFADGYNCNGTLIHSDAKSQYGENLALGYDTISAIDAWYNEIDLYDYDNPVFSSDTGHFTQLVWKSSTLLGCGYKYCDSYFGQYTVCRYAISGNWADQFVDNVLPLA
ncbi:PR-1-like protein [Cyberlindnera jadinii NRRL Y-1542]|uniref:PR-1-like protein n=1 Tax=Cyberlindnera jadinii (strain ATCC 18201 / CBS 1600 / BCRC 20928 / JCM 3617 / NBRC 0987 / NRRL Y-1542) TaxID=983966 RepID=A0A1E4S738_CYBJN|nr:PR-1-like protein [Cyberlindnera jadinii NRRL Y-1542]ODV75202.1 PR-1-like protein [Cyberlindnera jadinii NRRL Y-1542]